MKLVNKSEMGTGQVVVQCIVNVCQLIMLPVGTVKD